MKGGFEGWVAPALFDTTVWVFAFTEMISAIEGVGCECEQAPASPAAYAKIAGAVVELDGVAVALAWGQLQEPALTCATQLLAISRRKSLGGPESAKVAL